MRAGFGYGHKGRPEPGAVMTRYGKARSSSIVTRSRHSDDTLRTPGMIPRPDRRVDVADRW